ncbi:dUTP diphosphatase [Paratissierella segnis]|uniref:dUTP diphosphatase n=1 Tax=Paratissierella segnis TaxID=2763679 RepID=A0A926ETQ6_9FIRM|nr:dUTP diphosphatase [Paratissierella segnis]MBC8588068.1 dUTP diphosphatase [Paratissierella segnis]
MINSKEAWKCALDIEGEDKGMNLKKLYKMQDELDKYIIKIRNIAMSDEELLDKTILALLVEVGELANATRCFKHWSTKGPESKERLLDELADVLHFYLSIGNQLDIYYINDEIREYEKIRDMTNTFKSLYYWISKLNNTDIKNVNSHAYYNIGIGIKILTHLLGFTDEEVEQAYLKKHEENYRRQRDGY